MSSDNKKKSKKIRYPEIISIMNEMYKDSYSESRDLKEQKVLKMIDDEIEKHRDAYLYYLKAHIHYNKISDYFIVNDAVGSFEHDDIIDSKSGYERVSEDRVSIYELNIDDSFLSRTNFKYQIDAITAINKALEIEPINVKFQELKALILDIYEPFPNDAATTTKLLTENNIFLENCISQFPDLAWPFFFKSKLSAKSSELNDAVIQITKAISINPKDKYYQFKHELLYKIGNFEDVLNNIQEAITLYPNELHWFFNNHDFLCISKHPEDELKNINHAIALFPTVSNLYIYKHDFLNKTSTYDNVIKNIDVSIALFPNNQEIFFKKLDYLIHQKKNTETECLIKNHYSENSQDFIKACEHIFIQLYNQKQFELIVELSDSLLTMKELYKLFIVEKWIYFWACVCLNYDTKASQMLKHISFEDTLHTADQNVLVVDWNNHLTYEKISIDSLFNIEIPFELLPDDLFVSLIHKIYKSEFDLFQLNSLYNQIKSSWENEPKKIKLYAAYGEKYKNSSVKLEFFNCTRKMINKLEGVSLNLFYKFSLSISLSLNSTLQDEITITKDKERNRIISNLSHSIKNMISSAIIDPLALMKPSSNIDTIRIKEALKGADLIRQMVNAMNQSSIGTLADFIYDAHHTTKESVFLSDLIYQTLVYSIGNMFDGKYFGEFQRAYFPDKAVYLKAYSQWEAIIQSNDMSFLQSYLQEFFFDMEISLVDIESLKLGDEKGSSVKFLILLQEILLNAVKYSAFVERQKRFLALKLQANSESIELYVSNSFKQSNQIKSTGLGNEIISNFAKLLETSPQISKDEGIYSLELIFINIWRNDEDTVH
jgi:tetratricopeptide (TPR) repeat protein